MEKLSRQARPAPVGGSRPARPVTPADWRVQLPVLSGTGLTLRELVLSDAPALHALLTMDEVARFISAPPPTVEGFEQFVLWTQRERAEGRYACFAIVPGGTTTAVGLFQVRALEPGFGTAEWGFALGAAFWGSGVFMEAARRVVDFAVDVIGVRRLEARAAVSNGRGNGALRKLGAVQEGVLRRAFGRQGRYVDQVMWSILADDWRQARATWGPSLVH
ncbi:MAG: GNAT family N-acetyltransferase [Vicinamibacterales bacterium]